MRRRKPRSRRHGGLFLLQLWRPLSPSPALSHRLPHRVERNQSRAGRAAGTPEISQKPQSIAAQGRRGWGSPPHHSWSPQDWRQGDPEAAAAPGDKPSKASQGGGADGKAQMRGAWLIQPPKLCAREHEADGVPGTHGRGRAPHLCTSPGPGTSEPCVPASFSLAPSSFQSLLLLQLNELKHLFHSFH